MKKARCLSSCSNHMKNNIFLLTGAVYSNAYLKNKIDLINKICKDGILRHQQDTTNKQLLPYKYTLSYTALSIGKNTSLLQLHSLSVPDKKRHNATHFFIDNFLCTDFLVI